MPRTPSVLVVHKLLPHHQHQIEPITRMLAEEGVRVETIHMRDVVPYLDGKRLTAVTAAGHPIEKYDAVYFFGVTNGNDLNRLRALKASGLRVINDPDAIYHTANKHLCSVALAAAGVPVPPHLLLSGNKGTKQAAVRKLGPRMILKPTNGSLGRDVALIQNPGVLERVRTKDDTVAQEYLPDAAQGDLRVFVVGGKVVAAMLRVPARGEHRANLARGGKGFMHTLTEQEEAVALAAVKALGLDFGGVDIVPAKSGPLVIEVNSRPGHKIAEITNAKTHGAIAKEVARIARAEARRKRDEV